MFEKLTEIVAGGFDFQRRDSVIDKFWRVIWFYLLNIGLLIQPCLAIGVLFGASVVFTTTPFLVVGLITYEYFLIYRPWKKLKDNF